jgi:hypothetical protein
MQSFILKSSKVLSTFNRRVSVWMNRKLKSRKFLKLEVRLESS